MANSKQLYPDWICMDCGHKAQPDKSKISIMSTFHQGKCGVCGEYRAVTEPRDYEYPKFEKKD